MLIKCLSCKCEVDARLTGGHEIYPHLPNLYDKLFYRCDTCGNYVGCHKGTEIPLGVIPSPEIRKVRQRIHRVLDPIWRQGIMKRGDVYKELSKRLGYDYHTANVETTKQAEVIMSHLTNMRIEHEFWNE